MYERNEASKMVIHNNTRQENKMSVTSLPADRKASDFILPTRLK